MTTNAKKKSRQKNNRIRTRLIHKQRRLFPLKTGVHELTAQEINKRPYKQLTYIIPTPANFL
jgi:hypothetical protein